MKLKVLVIEDHPDTRLGLCMRLKADGFEVFAAADGIQGLAMAQKEHPNLILLDLGLPAGDGLRVLQRLKQMAALESIPVIVVSGRDPTTHREQAIRAGAVDFLHKPIEARDLLASVRRNLPGMAVGVATAAVTSAANAEAAPAKKILLVEDDADTARGVAIRLRANGFDVEVANDTPGALQHATRNRPELILLDLGLPAGDGFVFLERLKANSNLAAVPVIVLSARDPATNRPRAIEAGACEFLQKPADNDVLLRAIRKALD